MSTVIVTTASASFDASILSTARAGLVSANKKTGEVVQAYADILCSVFNVKSLETGALIAPWFELKGAAKKGIKAERALFVAAFEAGGFAKPTIDVNWQRVKEASGYMTAGQRVKGNETVDDKTLADLKTILNRIFKSEEEGNESQSSDHKGALMDIFAALGGDVMKLG